LHDGTDGTKTGAHLRGEPDAAEPVGRTLKTLESTLKSYEITVLPGDGVGPEVTGEALRVLARVESFGLVKLNTTVIPCAGSYYVAHGQEWPDGSFERCKAADAILLGAIGHVLPNGQPVRRADGELAGYEQVIGLRTKLDLYANMRPVKLFPGVTHNISGRFRAVWTPETVDSVFFRENTEGAYAPGEFRLERGGEVELVVSPTIVTRRGAERIVRRAFELAMRRNGAPVDGKRRVTCVDKSNVIRAHRFFRDVFREVSREFPEIECDYGYVDAFTVALVSRPERFDVVVAPNLPGDIVTDLAAFLQGGMGMAASGNIGDHHAMFEPIHGSAPDIAGKNAANPAAAIMSAAMMLRWLGDRHGDENARVAADRIDHAVQTAIGSGAALTRDLGGQATTTEAADAILALVTA
jgi:3-isopropylmalate dehydrogenase